MLDTLILDAIKRQKDIQRLQETLDKKKLEINKFLEKRNTKKHIIEQMGKMFSANRIERITITYDVEKIKSNLDKEILNEILDKRYIVTDMNKLKGLLKKFGVDPKDFRKTLTVEENVNKETIKKLFDVGDITKEDLKGCYTAKLSKTIQLKELE